MTEIMEPYIPQIPRKTNLQKLLLTDCSDNSNNIIPKAFDKRVGPAVAKAVAEAAKRTGVARI